MEHTDSMGADCRWVIGGLAGFVLLLIGWIRQLLKENKEESNERIKDLKEGNEKIRKKGKEES